MNDIFERQERKRLVQQNNKLRKLKSRSPLKRLEMKCRLRTLGEVTPVVTFH